MKFYLVSTIGGHFKLFTNKKDAIAYKKEVNPLHVEMDKHEFEVTQVVIKNKQDVINLVNPLGGEQGEQWDAFY